MNTDFGDLTAEQRERFAAWVLVPRPRWMNPVMWALLTIPGCADLAERLHNYDLRRAVRVPRAKTSGTTQYPDRHGEADGPAAVAPHAAPSSTAAPSLLGTGSAGAAVGPMSEGVRSGLPRPADRPAPSGSSRSGGAS